MARCDAAQKAKEAEPERPYRCDLRQDRATEGRHSREGRASFPNPQATIWLLEDQIPGAGEEHCSNHYVICVGQSLDDAKSAAKIVERLRTMNLTFLQSPRVTTS